MADMVEITINGQKLSVEKGMTILEAAKKARVKIPTLCRHEDLKPWAACGLCVVKVENSPKMVRACATEVVEGSAYITHDPELMQVRRTVLELIQSSHPNECLTCGRNGTCELQSLAADFGIRENPFRWDIRELPRDESTKALVFDPRKCINCGRCALVCQDLQDVWALEFTGRGFETRLGPAGAASMVESPCVRCGQCSAHCPVGAIFEKDETRSLMDAVNDPEKHVAVQIAPAVRVGVGEAFGLPPGKLVTGQIYAALRKLGVDAVFDTSFSADLTIMEEGSEFAGRLLESKGGPLPQITSCCPAWTDYMEKYFPDMIPHFSSAKSPMMMQGAITKTYYAQKSKIDPKNIYSVAIMPCTAKKYEITRDENMYSSGVQDVDLSLTSRELARLIKSAGIDFLNLVEEKADSPIGAYSGAGVLFGATGGVMEAALRTAQYLLTKKELPKVEIDEIRGMEGVRVGELKIAGKSVRVAIAHGMANIRDLMNEVREAREAKKEPPYHFIEVMACRGGCISGGGQPYGTTDTVRRQRIEGIYKDDVQSTQRQSHNNPEIVQIYKEFLGKPLSKMSHDLLHTSYRSRPLYKQVGSGCACEKKLKN